MLNMIPYYHQSASCLVTLSPIITHFFCPLSRTHFLITTLHILLLMIHSHTTLDLICCLWMSYFLLLPTQDQGHWEQGNGWWHQVVDVLGGLQRLLTRWGLQRYLPLLDPLLLLLQGQCQGHQRQGQCNHVRRGYKAVSPYVRMRKNKWLTVV